MNKYTVKYIINRIRRQKTVIADSIYNAERKVREFERDYSHRANWINIKTIKTGNKVYIVNSTTLD